jgi:CTP-dependent riboflavin kinase
MLHYFYLIIFQAKCAVGTKVCGVGAFSFFLKHAVYHYIKKKKGGKNPYKRTLNRQPNELQTHTPDEKSTRSRPQPRVKPPLAARPLAPADLHRYNSSLA